MTHAEFFLHRLGGEQFTFQTFNEKDKGSHKMRSIFHGKYGDHSKKFARWNDWGAGIFVTINETDLQGRRESNITSVRALFADLDGAPLDPVYEAKFPPHLVVQSSKEKYHAYWLVAGFPLDLFGSYQRAIAQRFGSDPVVCDLPRVMRLPGFYHNKGEKQLSRIVDSSGDDRYSQQQIKDGLELELSENSKKESDRKKKVETGTSSPCGLKMGLYKGSRNRTLFRVACAMRGRGEYIFSAIEELNRLAEKCLPPLSEAEVKRLVNNVWARY